MRKLWAKQNGSDLVGSENFATCDAKISQHCEIFWAFPLAPASPLLQNFDKNCKNKHRKNSRKMKNQLKTKINLKLEII